ncbi:hypothetical protein SAMD00024442_50_5 [Candidatus Symbiothrix dinenymphae]|nr:hypothetical protein SAMD00024442_50_5 [Candidatus Symbiothrix dinenymphae]
MNDALLKKVPSWAAIDGLQMPPRLALEQCSSEATARYKSQLPVTSYQLPNGVLVDLTGGFGVDTAFMSVNFSEVDYVEHDADLAAIAAHNFAIVEAASKASCHCGLVPQSPEKEPNVGQQSDVEQGIAGQARNDTPFIRTHVADAVEYLQAMQPVDCIYIDPARRDGGGKKLMCIADCSPDVVKMQDLLLEKAQSVLIKLSPMLDISAALKALKHVAEIHVVSVDNECKELLFLLKRDFVGEPLVVCANIKGAKKHAVSFLYSEEQQTIVRYCAIIKKYLYEPNVAILKAGFFKGIAARCNVEKWHPNSHLYTSDELIADFPGRIFEVEAQAKSLSKNSLREFLAGITEANITTRNFPMTTADLRQKLRLKEGGGVYLFGTTIGKKAVLIKTKKV